MRSRSVWGLPVLLLIVLACLARGDPHLSLGSANVLTGQTATISLQLTASTEPCAGVNAKIILPDGVSLVGVEKGGLMASGQFTLDYRSISGGGTVIGYSGSDVLNAPDGVAMRLRLHVAGHTAPGIHSIPFAAANTNIKVNARHALSDAAGDRSIPHTVGAGSLVVDRDDDGDGMGDAWESGHFQVASRDGTLDYDDDGVLDVDEYRNGTDPTKEDTDGDGLTDAQELLAGTSGVDGSDAFAINDYDASVSNRTFSIHWHSVTGRRYRVYAAGQVQAGWSNVHETVGNGFWQSYTKPGATQGSHFFRLGVQRDR